MERFSRVNRAPKLPGYMKSDICQAKAVISSKHFDGAAPVLLSAGSVFFAWKRSFKQVEATQTKTNKVGIYNFPIVKPGK